MPASTRASIMWNQLRRVMGDDVDGAALTVYGKASMVHTHAITDVTSLEGALENFGTRINDLETRVTALETAVNTILERLTTAGIA